MELRRILFICLLGMFSINILADNYKFDYAVINNEKVTTVNAPTPVIGVLYPKIT